MEPGENEQQDTPADQDDDPFACFDEWAGEADRRNYGSLSSAPTDPAPGPSTQKARR